MREKAKSAIPMILSNPENLAERVPVFVAATVTPQTPITVTGETPQTTAPLSLWPIKESLKSLRLNVRNPYIQRNLNGS
jgi:hypothetical protein